MTCIVGILQNDQMWIGGDAAVQGINNRVAITHPKVFRRYSYLVGCAGEARATDLVEAARLPSYDGSETYTWTVRQFVPAVHDSFKGGGYSDPDLQILLLVGGQILDIDSKLAVTGPYLGSMGAVGSGGEYALGNLLGSWNFSPKTRLKKALEAAAYFHPGQVCEPFTILSAKI